MHETKNQVIHLLKMNLHTVRVLIVFALQISVSIQGLYKNAGVGIIHVYLSF